MTSKKKHKADLKTVDPVWNQIRSEAEMLAAEEPFMASLAHSVVLHHHSLEHALSYRLAQKLSSPEMSPLLMREMADSAYADDPYMGEAGRAEPGRETRGTGVFAPLIAPVTLVVFTRIS